MNQIIGYGLISLGFAASSLGTFAGIYALLTKRNFLMKALRQWSWLIGFSALGAFIVMQIALFQRDFTIDYVRQVGSFSTPALFNFAAIWSSLEGSLMLWVLVLAGYLIAVTVKFAKKPDDELLGWALVVMFGVSTFFFALLVGPANPFFSSEIPAGFIDGPGPNPLLQNHILVAFHPPMLYLGYVGFTVSFAFAIASLVTGRVGEGWLLATRRWTVAAWCFLTLGIVLGAWWSYEVLGWGGFWAWDPVENASLLPWLTGTAFLHSVMIQERRGILRVWNLSLVCATFCLTIFGTFLTRSGVFDSVHAFSDGEIGPWLLGFFAFVTLGSIFLIGWRGDLLSSKGEIGSVVSREAAFLANNFLFGALAFVILVGTTFPLLAELLDGSKLTIARPYFDSMGRPIGFMILFLMAVAPIIPWGKANEEVLRQRLSGPAIISLLSVVVAILFGARGFYPLLAFGLAGFAGGSAFRQLSLSVKRRGLLGLLGRTNGGMIVHLGVVLLSVGLVASESYRTDRVSRLEIGEETSVGGHVFKYIGSGEIENSREQRLFADIEIDGKDIYSPAITRYVKQGIIVPTPSVRSSLDEDVYLVLDDAPEEKDAPIRLRVILRPLVIWLWIGGALMGLGSFLALVPANFASGKNKKESNVPDPKLPIPATTEILEPEAIDE